MQIHREGPGRSIILIIYIFYFFHSSGVRPSSPALLIILSSSLATISFGHSRPTQGRKCTRMMQLQNNNIALISHLNK